MTLPVPPNPPATVDSTTWQAWDIALRYAQFQADQQYRIDYLAAFAANTAALNAQAQSVAQAATAQMNAVTALDNYTDAELTAKFMAAINTDWGSSSRGSAYVLSLAQSMVSAYRGKYPAPAPAPAPAPTA